MALIATLKELEQKRQSVLAAKTNPSPWPPGAAAAGVVVAAAGGAVVWPDPNQQQANPPAGPAGTQPFFGNPVATGQAQNGPPVAAPVAASANFAPPAPALDPAAQEALMAALNDQRADSATETAFRQFVRLRLRSGNGPLGDEVKQQVESTGPLAYGLSALQAKRVVHQEAQTWAALQPKINVYRDTFAALAQDGKMSAEERAALRTLAKNLSLSEADVKSIESGLKFIE